MGSRRQESVNTVLDFFCDLEGTLRRTNTGKEDVAMSDAMYALTAVKLTREPDAVLSVDDKGTIWDCNPASEVLFGCKRNELTGRHISVVLPELENSQLVQDGRPNPRLRFLCRIGRHFRVALRNGRSFPSDLFLNCLDDSKPARLQLIVHPVGGGLQTSPGSHE